MSNIPLTLVHVGIPNMLNYRYVMEMRYAFAQDKNVRWDSITVFDMTSLDSEYTTVDGLANAACERFGTSCRVHNFIVSDNDSLNLLRLLHKQGRITLEVTFYDIAACDRTLPVSDTPPATGEKVAVAANGKLSHWPASVLDLSGDLLDALID